MKFSFKRQIRICAIDDDGKSICKIFDKGEHEVENIFVNTEYFEAFLEKGDITQQYVKGSPILLNAQAEEKVSGKTAKSTKPVESDEKK